jgi:protein-tyrosine phosphatase
MISADSLKQVLFLCTGNYYRSRFAEHLFNWLATKAELPWRAESRGLTGGHPNNIGPISRYALEGLELRGVPIDSKPRYPVRVTLADLTRSDLVIAVKESEHRARLAEQFPLWAPLAEYWHVDDLDCADPEEALAVLDGNVRALVARLAVC